MFLFLQWKLRIVYAFHICLFVRKMCICIVFQLIDNL